MKVISLTKPVSGTTPTSPAISDPAVKVATIVSVFIQHSSASWVCFIHLTEVSSTQQESKGSSWVPQSNNPTSTSTPSRRSHALVAWPTSRAGLFLFSIFNFIYNLMDCLYQFFRKVFTKHVDKKYIPLKSLASCNEQSQFSAENWRAL